ncbi:MAG: protein-methionine-sulfoxide reductase catalytic subunit MsrP [Parvularculales bacterium]
MLIKIKRGWEISENSITPESVFFNRRRFLGGAIAAAASVGALGLGGCGEEEDNSAQANAQGSGNLNSQDPSTQYYPAPRNKVYSLDREVTPESITSTYNNFYEFGSHKRISAAAQALPIRPWEVTIDGMVNNPMTTDIDDLLKKVTLEERLYRHRCVEAWAMAVPWTGFPLKELVALADPLSSAQYVRMETFLNPDVARGQRQGWYPWPYDEGLTLAEANNDMAFMVTGVYGKPLLKQFGAPLRLAVPWKYGFKSIKSIVRFTFTDKRPVSFWEEVLPEEYGFWANVNPTVPHPRWSQASEELLGTGGRRVPTQLFNGYGEEVALLYKGLEGQRLYM